MDLYSEIIDLKNIRKAYLKICEDFDLMSKTHKYSGIDSKKIFKYDMNSEELFIQVQKELIELKQIDPVLLKSIPKKGKKGRRDIYIFTIKERVKSQAIYQVLEPIFDNYYTKYLYSYRKKYTHRRAIKNFSKLYRKKYSEHVLIGDVSNYVYNIDRNILLLKLKEMDLSQSVLNLVSLFIDNYYIHNAENKKNERGVMTGTPLTVFFMNIYLDEMDKKISQISDFYLRVGDDFLVMGNEDHLKKVKQEIENVLKKNNLDLDKQKMEIKKLEDEFVFLGYHFKDGVISIPEKTIKNIKTRWRKCFKFYPINMKLKIKRFEDKLFGKESIYNDLIQIVYQYNQMNNFEQIKKLSEYFFGRVCIYFFEKNNHKNIRKMKKIIEKYKIVSFVKIYTLFHFKGKNNDYLQKITKRNSIKRSNV